jgi:hypothetical protein
MRPRASTFNAIFLAYCVADIAPVMSLQSTARARYPDVSLVDHTVRIDFEAPAAEALRERVAATMSRCDAVIALIGSGIRLDEWVAWEMREARRRNLPVVALLLATGSTSCVVPGDLQGVPVLRGSLSTALRALARVGPAQGDATQPSES